jgi:hypothetical protein
MNQLDLWRQVALHEMQQFLKPMGFRKSGINFKRFQNRVWMMFNLQSSSWNVDGEPMTLYGNIGLHYSIDPKDQEPGKSPRASASHWQGRVPGNQGQAFTIHSEDEARQAGLRIAAGGLEILDTLLRRYPSPEEMLQAHVSDRFIDKDLNPWSSCLTGILRRELNGLRDISSP